MQIIIKQIQREMLLNLIIFTFINDFFFYKFSRELYFKSIQWLFEIDFQISRVASRNKERSTFAVQHCDKNLSFRVDETVAN